MRCVLLAVCVGFGGSSAVAAPVPKTSPPNPKSAAAATLVVLKGEPGPLAVSMPNIVYVTKTGTRTVEVDGRQQAVQYTYQEPVTVMTTIAVDTSKGKVTTADGKELSADDLRAKLKAGMPAVLLPAGQAFDPEWRKLFADGVVFVEPPQPEKK